MKNSEAPGPVDIPAEVWKLLGDRDVRILTALSNRMTSDDRLPGQYFMPYGDTDLKQY